MHNDNMEHLTTRGLAALSSSGQNIPTDQAKLKASGVTLLPPAGW